MRLEQAFKQFIIECQNGRYKYSSDKTVLKHQTTFKLFLQWLPIENVQDLSEDVLWRFFNRGKTTRNWKPATIITHRNSLSVFIKWCKDRQYLTESPLEKIPRPRLIKNPPQYYSEEEMNVILAGIYELYKRPFNRIRNRAMIGTLLLAGLRKGELLNLKICDIDFEHNVIRIKGEYAKNKKPRTVMISPQLRGLLEEYYKIRQQKKIKSYSLWVSSNNFNVFTEHGYKHMLQSLSEYVGFTVKSHKCRHTFATYAYKGSKDIMAVKDVLGHEDIKTTMGYAHVLPELTKVAVMANPINDLF